MAKINMQKGKRGQITIFIILAILIVASLLIYFLWIQPAMTNQTGKLKLDNCISDALETEIPDLAENAGLLNPKFTYQYMGQNITYVCYTDEYYQPCIVQEPFLLNTFETSLEKSMRQRVQACYDGAIEQLRAEGYEVKSGEIKTQVLIQPTLVEVNIEAPTTITKESSQQFRQIKVTQNSQLYEILMIATSLLQYETAYGDTDTTSSMFFYPDIIIDKMKRSDGTTVYTVESKTEEIKFKFASRSYAWPAGYGI